jgi:hypothetical protein
LSAGIVNIFSTDDIHDIGATTPFSETVPRAPVEVDMLVFVLVVVVPLTFPIPNCASIVAELVLTKLAILRLTGVPVVPTIAPDIRTGSFARITVAVEEQSVPEHDTRLTFPSPIADP